MEWKNAKENLYDNPLVPRGGIVASLGIERISLLNVLRAC